MTTFVAKPEHVQFVEHYGRVVDSMSSKDFALLFAEDGEFSLGNFPTSTGHEAIAQGGQGIFSIVAGLKHTDRAVYSIGEGDDPTTFARRHRYGPY
jgi:hypothetical protein